MTNQEIKNIILSAIKDYFEINGIKENASDDTVLFGINSSFDSLGFVNIIVDIENRLKEEQYDVTLTSEKAMSRKNSPFKSVQSLADFIEETIGK